MPPTTSPTSTGSTPSETITRLLLAIRALQAPPPLPPPSITAPPSPNVLHRLISPSNNAARTILLTLHLLFPHDFLPALDLLDRGLLICLSPAPSTRNTTATAALTAPTLAASTATSTQSPTTSPPINLTNPPPGRTREVYYIQSASAITEGSSNYGAGSGHGHGGPGAEAQGGGRFRNAMARPGRGKATDTFYEVRLDSWNCSCAAFAAQGFGLLGIDDEGGIKGEGGGGPGDGSGVLGAGIGNGGGRLLGEGGREPRDEVGGDGAGEERDRDFMFGGTAVPGGIAPVCKHILAAAVAKNLPDFAMPPARDGGEWKREVSATELAGWGAGWGDRG